MLSDKYIAGLIDSDGYLGIQVNKRADGTFLIRPRVTIKQVSWRDRPLQELANRYKTKLNHEEFPDKDWKKVSTFVVTSDKALRLIELVKNHLVIKCDIAEFLLKIDKSIVTEQQLKDVKVALKNLRNSHTNKIKNYPSRKWLAGYFDGDGMIRATLRKSGGVAVVLRFFGYKYDRVALELIQKVFGGSIKPKGERGLYYNLTITINNVDKVLGYFQQHTIIKNDQLQYVLGYIKSGKHLLRRGQGHNNKQFVENLSAMKSPASTK